MKVWIITLSVGLCLLLSTSVWAQETAADETPAKWETGVGLGLDAAQLLQINPRVGAGQNRLGFGGAINAFGKYRNGRLAWDNQGVWQFGIQRLGSGVIAQGTTRKIPFQKAIDEIRLDSKFGFQASEKSKWFYAANVGFISQIAPTYLGTTEYPGNFLSDISGTNAVAQSRFLSPGQVNLSVGIDYKPNDTWSFYFSPVAGRFLIVANDVIAARGVHGNPVTKDAGGNVIAFKNVDSQLGALLRIGFINKFIDDRLTYTAAMQLYSNYVREPQNIDLQFWTNELAMEVFKGFQVALTVNAYYDHDVKVQITDYKAPNGVSGLGRRPTITQQLLLKYSLNF
ncbi:MAG: DUF3078 domain-containing protein [Lewinellaceae bacterium]|nr:DUF3078 domain-containing protein [Lewinellaceae bacterium]